MVGGRVALVCHYCQTTTVKEGCTACAELRATWSALATTHAGRDIPKPDTVEVTAPGAAGGLLVLTQRDSRAGWIVILVMSALVFAHLGFVLLLTRRPQEIAIIFAVIGSICLVGVVFAIRGLRRRLILRIDGGVLTRSEGSRATTLAAGTIAQLVVHANHSSYSHKSHLRTFVSAKLLARTGSGDVSLLEASLEDVRFIEAQIERHLWIQDDPRQNVVTTSG